MRVAFLTPSLSRSSGGIFEIERRLAQCLAALADTRIEVYGAADEFTDADLPLWTPLRPHVFPSIGPDNFRYSRQLQEAFLRCDAEVAHLHALWMHTSLIISKWGRRKSRPYITTANGMLDAWALRNSRFKKRVVGILYERRCLESAACIHVNSEAELEAVRDFGLLNPVCIIPNGVDTIVPQATTKAPWQQFVPEGENVLLYLGRLHPKKNLAALLHAWRSASGSLQAQSWNLVIAGWDQLGHGEELRALSAQLNCKRVAFLSALYGEEKSAAFRDASAVILPSLSEGLPMVVLEAWAARKPVLMTSECNLLEGFSAGAALKIGSRCEEISAGLEFLFAASCKRLCEIGVRGSELVARKFSWSVAARQLRAVYGWIAGEGPVPETIRLP